MPPIHWAIARHMKRVAGTASKSVTMVAPVVVNPLIDSNMAGRKLMSSVTRKGSDPTSGTASQVRSTVASASRLVGSEPGRPSARRPTPRGADTVSASANPRTSSPMIAA